YLEEQKASQDMIGSCNDVFIPNPYTAGDTAAAEGRTSRFAELTRPPTAVERPAIELREVSAAGLEAAEELIAFYTHVFVGRRAEIERLMSLAAESKPGYVHVRGPAGSGKSALIANVVHRLRQTAVTDGGPVLLYTFVQDRRTDLRGVLQSLCTQL